MRAPATSSQSWRALAVALASLIIPVTAASAQTQTVEATSDGRARALLSAAHEATLSSDGALLIDRIYVDIGERFRKDDPLIEFNCALRRARVTATEGVHKGAVARLQSKQRLVRSRTIGQLEVDLAGAEAQKAAGDLAEAQDAANRCVIKAPFAGRVAKRHANAYEFVGPDRPLLSIVSDGPLRVNTIVPSTWLRWLKVGDAFEVAVDETGKIYPAKVAAIAGRVDAASQSIELLGRIEDEPAELRPGMSGGALFEPRAAQ
jgi:membrane fusion protein, multidrug efflux system